MQRGEGQEAAGGQGGGQQAEPGRRPQAGGTGRPAPLKGEELADTTALMFERRSYESFATTWPGSTDHALYKDLPKYVVSTTLGDEALVDGWGPTTILRSTDEVAALKEEDGGAVFLHGSAELARRLAGADLIDRYHLLVFPVLLGAGKSLFDRDDREKRMLVLRDPATYVNGIVKLVYDVRR